MSAEFITQSEGIKKGSTSADNTISSAKGSSFLEPESLEQKLVQSLASFVGVTKLILFINSPKTPTIYQKSPSCSCCACVCVCACACMYVCVCVHACVRACVCERVCVWMNECMHVCAWLCAQVRACVCVCVCVCSHITVSVHVCTHACKTVAYMCVCCISMVIIYYFKGINECVFC